MQERQRLAHMVLVEGISISAACLECGVSRPTGSMWVSRARESGIANMTELSRRPQTTRQATPLWIEEEILRIRGQYPAWGAAKIRAVLWPPPSAAPVSVRTIERVLQRAGRTVSHPPRGPMVRFEREHCNELWQMDFKGLELCWGYRPLSLLDDCSRFCLALTPMTDRGTESVWSEIWRLFGEYGMPHQILCDNGDCWGSTSKGPTHLAARLWRLGVKTTHGRAYHPQTQGKVERFHRTLEVEGAHLLRQVDVATALRTCEQLRQHYNWIRPHEALGQQMPGAKYRKSERARPHKLPPAQVPPGAMTRKVDSAGMVAFRGKIYRAGKGLSGERVEIREEANGHAIFYTLFRIGSLDDLKAFKDSP